MVSITMSTTSAFISSPTTLKLRKKSNTNKRSNNSLLKIAKAISVADVTGPVKETIKDVQSVEVQNTMRFSFSRGRIRIIIARIRDDGFSFSSARTIIEEREKKRAIGITTTISSSSIARKRERKDTQSSSLALHHQQPIQFNSQNSPFFCLVSFFLYPFFLKDNTNRGKLRRKVLCSSKHNIEEEEEEEEEEQFIK